MAAEPGVRFGEKQLHLPRPVASGLGVSISLVFLFGIVTVLGAVAVRQLGNFTSRLPDVETALQTTKNAILSATDNAPEPIRKLTQTAVNETLHDGAAFMSRLAGNLPKALSAVASGLGSSALGVGTGVLAAFLISARLPDLRQRISSKLPPSWHEKILPALRRFRQCLWSWLKAQGKLALVTWAVVSFGFWVIGIPRPPLWAAVVALVDAVPVLGTGTILVPWALISLLQGNGIRAAGLMAIYGVAAITRTVLEPRVVGRQLGMDPLLTLVAMYAGFQFWGIPGMLFTPILASAAKSVFISD